ncbi:SWIM zinc finger family protein [Lactiplantibacillus paraxiangfangensis]|uniref:SWIM zinc finger family protein n=1 Tax=Lactiplantibacillus paraxiangfangensis TaxID=3076224 RepID=UPI0030C66A1F
MNWKTNFQPQILQRGSDYNDRGLVRHFKIVFNQITATVTGSNDYSVTIKTDPLIFHCTCPYASNGHLCKHMAAVLFHSEQVNSTTDPFSSGQLTKFQLSLLPYLVAKDFAGITNLTAQLFAQFNQQQVSDRQLDLNLQWTLTQLITIPATHADLVACFQWTGATYLQFVDRGNNQTRLHDQILDSDFQTDCSLAWQNWYQKKDSQFNDFMFGWLCQHIIQLPWTESLALGKVLFNFHFYLQPNEQKKKLAVIDNKLASFSEERAEHFGFLQFYQGTWIRYRVSVMISLDLPTADTQDFCNTYCSYPVVHRYFLKRCQDLNEKQTAISYLKRCLDSPQLGAETKHVFKTLLTSILFSWNQPFFVDLSPFDND